MGLGLTTVRMVKTCSISFHEHFTHFGIDCRVFLPELLCYLLIYPQTIRQFDSDKPGKYQ